MLINSPYALGMFSIHFFYELVSQVFGYQRICIASAQSCNASSMSSFLFLTTFMMHLLGFVISVFGTRKLIETFGEKICLMMVPAINFLLFIYFMIFYTPFSFIVASVVTKAVHYAFSYPLKESLYIPTVKEIKFKTKSWIDTFGQKFARAAGSTFNDLVRRYGSSVLFSANLTFFGLTTGMWLIVAYFLGKRYETAIANNEVIGLELTEFKEKEGNHPKQKQ